MGLIRGYMNILVRVQARQAAAQLAQIKGGLKQLQGAHVGAGNSVGFHESKMQAWLRTGTKFGNQLQWTGRQLQYNWTLPLAAAGVAATKWQLANEAAMTRVKKVYGDADLQKALGTAGITRELNALGRAFQALSDHYGVQQEEVIKIGAAWAAAGASGIALAKGTELTLKAMVLGEMDATKATEALISIQSQWHLTTEGMNNTLAELNIIENQTATSMQDLIEAFARASGVARNAGITTRELGAMVAAIVPAAGSAANAGNALKTIISRLLAPTNEAREVLGMMGVNIKESGWQSVTAARRLEILSAAFTKLDTGQKAAVSSAVASRWQLNRFDILMEAMANTNSYYSKALEATADKTQYMKQAQSELNAVLTSNPQRLKQVWVILQNAATDVIQPLIPFIVALGQELAILAGKFAALDPQIQHIVIGLAIFLAAIGPVAKYLGSTITLIHILAGAFAFLAKPFTLVLGMMGLMGKRNAAIGTTAKNIGLMGKAGNALNFAPKITAAGGAVAVLWRKFDPISQITGRLKGVGQMMLGIIGLAGVMGRRIAAGGAPIRTVRGRVDTSASKRAAQQQTAVYSAALQAGMWAAFSGLGGLMSRLWGGLTGMIKGSLITGLKAIPGILFRFLLGPFGVIITAVLGVLYLFRDQIGQVFSNIGSMLAGPWNAAMGNIYSGATFLQRVIQFVKNAFWSLPVEVQNAMIAVVTVVRDAALAVYQWFSYINPFARHSPSLVENVSKGVSAINASFSGLNVQGPIDKAYSQIKKLKDLAGNFMRGMNAAERKENLSKLAKVAPKAVPAYKALAGTLDVLQGKLDALEPKIRKQEQVVKAWQQAIDALNDRIDIQQEKLDAMQEAADKYSDAISAAQDKISELASAPLKGMGEMEDAIFANTQEQNRLRLEMLKMEDAGQSFDDIKSKVNALAGDIETLRATQSDLRAGGAGSEILKFYDEEAKKLAEQKDTLEQQKGPYQELEDQLDELQRKAEMLDLEKALKFDGATREIEKLANAQKELTFDEIIKGIKDNQAVINTYTPKLNDANAAIAKQEAYIKSLEAQRKILEKSYDTENAKLDRMKDAYQDLGSAISDVESALNLMNQAASKADQDAASKASKKLKGKGAKGLKGKKLTPAGQAFMDAKGSNFPIQGDPNAKIGREGGLGDQSSLIDQYTKDLSDKTGEMFRQFDPFAPLKQKWADVTNWFKSNIQPAWKPIKDGIVGIFAGIDWTAPFKDGTAIGEMIDTVKQKLIDAWNWIKGAGGFLQRWFGPDIMLLVREVKDAFTEAWGDIKAALGDIDWKSVGIIFAWIGKAILDMAKIAGGILVVALKLVVSLLARVLGPAIKLVTGLFRGIIKVIGGIIDVVAGLMNRDWKRIGQGLKKITDGLQRILQEAFVHIGQMVLGVIETALDLVPSTINAIFKTDLPSVRELVNNILTWFGSLKTKLPESLQKVWDAVVGFFKKLWDELTGHSIVPDMINSIVKCFTDLPGKLAGGLSSLWKTVTGKFNDLKTWGKETWSKGWNAMTGVIKNPVSSAKTAIGTLLGKTGLRSTFSSLKSWGTDTWSKSWSGMTKVMKDPVGSAKTAIGTLLGKTGVRKAFTDLWSWFSGTWIGKSWNLLKGKITKPLSDAKATLSDILTGKKSIKSVFSEAATAIGKAWDKVKGEVKEPIKFVIQTVLDDGILGAFRKIGGLVGMKTGGWHVGLPKGWDTGGWTGPGAKMKAAGIVHADEFVVKKSSRRQFEKENPGTLDYINRYGTLPGAAHGAIKGYAEGGKVGEPPKPKTVGGKIISWIIDKAGKAAQAAMETVSEKIKAPLDKLKNIPSSGIVSQMASKIPGKLVPTMISWIKGKGLDFIKAHTKKIVKSVPSGGGGDGGYKGPVGAGAAGIRKIANSFHPSYIAGHRDPQGGPAFDIGSSGQKNKNIGNALRSNHGKLGLRYVIRQMQISSARGGWGWRRYSPITNAGDWAHVNHVHVSYRRGTKGAPGGLALVGEAGPELMNLKPGTSIASNDASKDAVSEALNLMVSRAFARGMSSATESLETAVVIAVGTATRRAERRIDASTGRPPIDPGAGRGSTRTVVISKAVFPNVKNADDAKAFIDNLVNVTSKG